MESVDQAAVSGPSPFHIPLRGRGGVIRAWTVVSEEDYERAAQYSWHLNSRGYACRQVPWPDGPRRWAQWSQGLQRFILGLGRGDAPGMHVDHIDHDKLNNRRGNLRLITVAENQQNRLAAPSHSTNKLRGVHFDRGKWVARGQVNGKRVRIGGFETAEEAAAAAEAWRREHMPTSVS